MKIALLGYGKMGKAIEAIVEKEQADEIVLTIDDQNIYELTTDTLRHADVAIEFSTPQSAINNIDMCLDAGVPIIVGTTGWYDHLDWVKKKCTEKNGAVLYASNFSIGVNILFALNKRLAELMAMEKNYHPLITEVHHNQKKDAPSGTAISLAKDILQFNKEKKKWVNSDIVKNDELPILSIREGDVKGIHEVQYRSNEDILTLRHEAFSRDGFALGAIKAAHWIAGKKGFFEFKEVLGL
jgi:4-hydroxy-tetrahydrodipicolinate reductase